MGRIQSAITTFLLLLPICLAPLIMQAQPADQDILLYTPYTSRSVTPGQTVSYSIEIINRTNSIQNMDLRVHSIPSSWNPTFTAGGNNIQQIAVKPQTIDSGDNTKQVSLGLNVPLKVKKGLYRFTVNAQTENGLEYNLPLNVQVTEEGIFQTELEVEQANMEGYTDSDLKYTFTLRNQTAQEQNYALTAEAPPGWDIRFGTGGDYVTSVTVASNEVSNFTVRVMPSQSARADTVRIPIEVRSGSTSDQATIEAVIKGKYGLKLTTPTGRLSTEVTAGSEKDIDLLLRNTGTVPLHDVELRSTKPQDWNVIFETKTISGVDPGESTTVSATINASNNAIAGDYELDITADTPNASSTANFRVTVKQSVMWGSIGVFIILAVIGGIFYLFKTYGRR